MKSIIQWDSKDRCIRVPPKLLWIVDTWGAIFLGLLFLKFTGIVAFSMAPFNMFFIVFFISRVSRAALLREKDLSGLAGWLSERAFPCR